MPQQKKKKEVTEKPQTLARETHKVYKAKSGDVMVDHTQRTGGKWDKINLTKKAGAKNVQQGVKAVQKYHRTTGK